MERIKLQEKRDLADSNREFQETLRKLRRGYANGP